MSAYFKTTKSEKRSFGSFIYKNSKDRKVDLEMSNKTKITWLTLVRVLIYLGLNFLFLNQDNFIGYFWAFGFPIVICIWEILLNLPVIKVKYLQEKFFSILLKLFPLAEILLIISWKLPYQLSYLWIILSVFIICDVLQNTWPILKKKG
jgi:hypothetical protein